MKLVKMPQSKNPVPSDTVLSRGEAELLRRYIADHRRHHQKVQSLLSIIYSKKLWIECGCHSEISLFFHVRRQSTGNYGLVRQSASMDHDLVCPARNPPEGVDKEVYPDTLDGMFNDLINEASLNAISVSADAKPPCKKQIKRIGRALHHLVEQGKNTGLVFSGYSVNRKYLSRNHQSSIESRKRYIAALLSLSPRTRFETLEVDGNKIVIQHEVELCDDRDTMFVTLIDVDPVQYDQFGYYKSLSKPALNRGDLTISPTGGSRAIIYYVRHSLQYWHKCFGKKFSAIISSRHSLPCCTISLIEKCRTLPVLDLLVTDDRSRINSDLGQSSVLAVYDSVKGALDPVERKRISTETTYRVAKYLDGIK
jgi:hypothetical protein